MKKIVLMSVKNEAWILRETLTNLSNCSDHILIADQSSDDGSQEIYKEFPKVIVISNPEKEYDNSVRWLLLDEARKLFKDTFPNLLICTDADEMLSKEMTDRMVELAKNHLDSGNKTTLAFDLPWIQLWKDVHHYRVDGVWKNSSKPVVFLDNEKLDYERTLVVNAHAPRVPDTEVVIKLVNNPLLHFQYISFETAQLKQAWYRASELLKNVGSARYINYKYSSSRDSKVKLAETPQQWLSSIPEALLVKPKKIDQDNWHLMTLKKWFSEKGILFFEGLDIWHIDILRDLFISEIGRVPRPKFYPKIIIWANSVRRFIKKYI
jgi:hypothetical protein